MWWIPIELIILISIWSLNLLWVLLPIVPAVLIFRLCHDTLVSISGQLMGLTISASGAFAGYLIVVLLMQSPVGESHKIIYSWNPPYWTVTGKIELYEADGKTKITSASNLIENLKAVPVPKLDCFERGESTATVLVVESKGRLPDITYKIRGFDDLTIERAILDAKKDDLYHKVIELGAIKLRRTQRPVDSQQVPSQQASPGILPVSSAN